MKRFITAVFAVIIALCSLFLFTACDEETKDNVKELDRIKEYGITVSPRTDATLDITYSFLWEVLDSTTEGPLTWVKIGVANMYVDEIRATTTNIDDIYYSSDGGAYINVYFDRKYNAGETLSFGFSIHQSRIFTKNDDGQITYRFNPGWFPEIKVESLVVKWKKSDDLVFNNADAEVGGYYVWLRSLGFNQTIDIDASYNPTAFPDIDPEMDYSKRTESVLVSILPVIIFAVIIIGVMLVVVISRYAEGDDYYLHRGYTGRYYGHYYLYPFRQGVDRHGKTLMPPEINNGSGGHGSGGSSCACACACACAGGGRAGCSRKDFCSANIDDISAALGDTETDV